MANPFSINFLDRFSVVFVMIFVFALVFGVLEVTGLFGKDKKNIHAIIALMMAIFAALTPSFVIMIKVALPWLSFMLIFFFFFVFFGSFLGFDKEEGIQAFLGGQKKTSALIWVLVGLIIIVIVGVTSIGGQDLLEEGDHNSSNATGISGQDVDSADYYDNVWNTLFNPTVAGVIMFLLIGVFTVMLLTRDVG